MSNKSANNVIDRIQIALNVQSDNEVCQALEIKRSTLGGWRSRDLVPYALCVELSEKIGLSIGWLLTGEGDMLKADSIKEVKEGYHIEPDIKSVKVLELFNALDEMQQREIFSALEEKKQINEMKSKINMLMSRFVVSGDYQQQSA